VLFTGLLERARNMSEADDVTISCSAPQSDRSAGPGSEGGRVRVAYDTVRKTGDLREVVE